MKHELRFSPRDLGGDGTKGTNARCTGCGWETFTNDKPPSRSKSWQRDAQARHYDQATKEWTLDFLQRRVTESIERLQRAVVQGSVYMLDTYGDQVAHRTKVLQDEWRAQMQAATKEDA